MATLVLTAAGSLLGPVGGAVGALLGQAIDTRLIGPKSRQGPRLQDLKVQTSSYGAQVPKLFGTMRAAGMVIWATDLVEHRTRSGGGKGRPTTTSYSYSASFAVLLSARPIRSVGRIWADGNLLRGAAGDWKSETGFRLHLGDADQAPDPLIASAEAAETPAYRGCAYAVFKHMALAPFGNRIPSLTFEVEADAEPVPVGTILEALSGGLVQGQESPALRGFAATGETVRALTETLGGALPLDLRDDGESLRIVRPGDETVLLTASEIADDQREEVAAASALPPLLTLNYYEPARDYQIGTQQVRRLGGRRALHLDLPAALEAGEARQVVEAAMVRRSRERGRRTLRCGWARLGLGPGHLVALPDDASLWRVVSRTIDREGAALELRRLGSAAVPAPAAEPGRSVSAPDGLHGPTVVHLLDLPSLTDPAPGLPRLYIAAAGELPGWRRANLMVSLDDGTSWDAIGTSAAPAIIGEAAGLLGAAGEALLDTLNSVAVDLLHAEMLLEDADDARLIAGANLALLGDELIQFGRAEPLGGRRWRLSRLVRGRRGTGWASAMHAAGERFVLIEATALLAFDPPASVAGTSVALLASGIGDPSPVNAAAPAIGAALRPPAPVHLTARRRDDGGFDIHWVRRSRTGWAWTDGADAQLGEEGEAYRLTISPAGGPARSYDLGDIAFHYPASVVADDLIAGPEVQLSVVQIGTGAASRPATLNLTL